MERLSHNHTDNSDELLSAYIDNAVDAGERRRAERYIAECAACAHEVQELRMFRQLLRDVPNVQPRRSFTLDPATVAPRRLLFPTLRWSSLVATLLFVVVLGVDVLGGRSRGAQPPMTSSVQEAESAAKGSPAAQPHFDSSGASGGSAETMMMPQASPAASTGADQGNPESASAPLTAEIPPATAAASPAPSAANDALPEVPPAAGAYPPQEAPAASASPAPAMASAQTPAALGDPAGGNTAQLPQTGFRADDPAAADTTNLVRDATAQGSWWSSYALRIAEVVLGLIALVLGGAALWAWRRQL